MDAFHQAAAEGPAAAPIDAMVATGSPAGPTCADSGAPEPHQAANHSPRGCHVRRDAGEAEEGEPVGFAPIPSVEADPLVSIEEAERIIGCKRSTIYNRMNERRLTGLKIGRSLRFRLSELVRFRDTMPTFLEAREAERAVGVERFHRRKSAEAAALQAGADANP